MTTLIETTATVSTTIEFQGADASDFVRLIEDYNAAKNLIKEMKAEQDRLEAEIRSRMGNATTARINGTARATIATRNRSNLDKDQLSIGWPEALEACTTHTTYTVLTAK